MRKWLPILLIASLLFITGKTFAQIDTDYGYVVVKCTVTIDVDVLDTWATAWFISIGNTNNGLSPNQEDVSVSSIAVVNKSTGAIVKYAVFVSSIHRTTDGSTWVSDDDDINNGIKGWELSDNNNQPGKFILAAVFASSKPATTDFATTEADDQFRINLIGGNPTQTQRVNYTYRTGGSNFDPATSGLRYASALSNSAINFVSPNENRGLWFYIKTPSAVTDTYLRRITIRVDAGLGSAWQ